MKEESLVKFLNALGCKDAAVAGDWVTCKCPLAPWTHKSGKDSTPSFGVHIEKGVFNCFACQKGTLETLLNTVMLYLSKPNTPEYLVGRFNIELARHIMLELESDYDGLDPYEEAIAPQESELFVEWPSWVLSSFTPAHLVPDASFYLQKRGVKFEDVQKFDLRYDEQRKMIVAPYRNLWGKLAGLRGRCIDPSMGLQHYDYKSGPGKNAGLVFYNEQVIPFAADLHMPVLVVEGQFDCIACCRHYPYTVGNLTAKPTWAKIATLNQCQDGVVLMLDNDTTGKEAAAEWLRKLSCKAGQMAYPDKYKDPDSMPDDLLESTLASLSDDCT